MEAAKPSLLSLAISGANYNLDILIKAVSLLGSICPD